MNGLYYIMRPDASATGNVLRLTHVRSNLEVACAGEVQTAMGQRCRRYVLE